MSGIRLLLRVLFAALLAALWLVLSLAIVGLFYRPNTQIPEDLQGQTLSVRGIPLRVLQNGLKAQGHDVLLIHGSPGSLEDWTPVYDALKSEFRVTVFDRQGHGWSGDSGVYSPSDNAETAIALMDQLDLHDVTVVGHSYGGAVALAMALRTPRRVAAYVIVDSAAYVPSRKVEPFHELIAQPVLGVGAASVLGTFLAPSIIRKGLEDVSKHTPPEDFVALRQRIWSTPKVLHSAARETVDAADALMEQSPRYPEIKRPVTVVAQADDLFRNDTARRLHRDIDDSRLVLLSGAGHYLQFDKTSEVVNAIRHALDAAAEDGQ
ncbi:MAG: hypothetical protein RL701_2111 [Pseudomonadota bacterium]|jgi:pimeloyl-ACP methyl ester carboxylesterase